MEFSQKYTSIKNKESDLGEILHLSFQLHEQSVRSRMTLPFHMVSPEGRVTLTMHIFFFKIIINKKKERKKKKKKI